MGDPCQDPPPRGFAGRGVRNVWVWAALGLGGMFCFMLGGEPGAPRSPLWFMELVLIGSFLAGLLVNARGAHLRRRRLPAGRAAAAYLALAYGASMAYELSLSGSPGNLGGCGDTTAMSFLIAPFAYLPILLGGLWVIRKRRVGFSDVFFFGGAASFAESLVFRPMLVVVVLSPMFFLAPFVLGYYVLVYGIFVSFPLLIIDERDLWSDRTAPSTPAWKLLAYGTVTGFTAALVFGIGGGLVGWALS